MIRLVYPNGISTSLPADVQQDFVRSIAGLERVEIVRPGYAVEYEYRRSAPARTRRWRCATCRGCSSPGRSTARPAMRKRPRRALRPGSTPRRSRSSWTTVRFDRRLSYIGVMIDDLTLQGVSEPYRMMTARAEYRLSLRADNATTRLGEAALGARLRVGAAAQRRSRRICASFGRRDWRETDEGRADALYAPYVERQQREWEVVQRDSRRVDSGRARFARSPGPVERNGRAAERGASGNARPGLARRRRYAGGVVGALRRGEPPRRGMIERLAQVAGRPVSRETFEKLEAYVGAACGRERAPESRFGLDARPTVGPPHPRFGAAGAVRAASPARRGSTSARAPGCPES